MTLSWGSEETLLLIILYFLGKIWGVSLIIVHNCIDVDNFFLSFQVFDWSRASQDVNTALSQNKPLVSVLFDKSTWNPEGHELGALLKSHGVCLDLSAGSGSALSHQYDQGQVNELISHCYGVLYGTGDIHPPEPPPPGHRNTRHR